MGRPDRGWPWRAGKSTALIFLVQHKADRKESPILRFAVIGIREVWLYSLDMFCCFAFYFLCLIKCVLDLFGGSGYNFWCQRQRRLLLLQLLRLKHRAKNQAEILRTSSKRDTHPAAETQNHSCLQTQKGRRGLAAGCALLYPLSLYWGQCQRINIAGWWCWLFHSYQWY